MLMMFTYSCYANKSEHELSLFSQVIDSRLLKYNSYVCSRYSRYTLLFKIALSNTTMYTLNANILVILQETHRTVLDGSYWKGMATMQNLLDETLVSTTSRRILKAFTPM